MVKWTKLVNNLDNTVDAMKFNDVFEVYFKGNTDRYSLRSCFIEANSSRNGADPHNAQLLIDAGYETPEEQRVWCSKFYRTESGQWPSIYLGNGIEGGAPLKVALKALFKELKALDNRMKVTIIK